ncbi:hypothetical protein P153DRAFT_364400 [Dothidotthia symphoricarpi CBS 119687]|uniref:FHA domain-containing protein n=1 Tax=Dothidotthia symphoricarpi CBS 119687 TaxID=1392245 RepID=A0A6A6AIY5_9PLEO|nr:uncharacterized protein P153DRAFT_364400 [Dothidotthia symphoricarpi CBS 119687]KAF2131932.1 hypothetical protein P153DRAFT_364400 [Dothidotthia symphoricarpi CBS 119687]
MWFLEHESLFGGKRVWLRPGSQQLFGRTKTDKDATEGQSWKIENKAVSRKHVMLKVLEPSPADGTNLHARSQIEVTDLSCRQGTTVDEKTILKSRKADDGTIAYDKSVLKGTEHTIRLAQGYAPFKIVWRPVVFTYASKEAKDSKIRSTQLHTFDIKTTAEFVFDKTTHVVSQKRNLPKVLSGLLSGKYVVTGDFLDAVLDAATASVDGAGNYAPSRLEEDFDAHWPEANDYVPPVGAEPVAQPHEMLRPDVSRSELFSGLTFVFLNESQYNSLHQPISHGGGKALLYDVRPGETTVQEYVDYVWSVLGLKKPSNVSRNRIPVVTVRLASYPDGMEDWAANFVTGVDQALNQRSILQNEFLDVIVTKDITSLRKPPAEVDEVTSSAVQVLPTRRSMRESTPASQSGTPSQATESQAHPTEDLAKTVPRKRVHRAKTTSRFTGFDDYEPPPKKAKMEDTRMQDIQESTEPSAQASAPVPTSPTRLDPSPTVHDNAEEQEEVMDALFPAAAEMKRRRAATRAPSASVEPESGVPDQKPKSRGVEAMEKLQQAKKKANKEINVREHTRLRIKEEDDRRKADEENLREALEGVDIAEMRNLAKIQEVEIRPRENRGTAQTQSQGRSERWNPEWNGRKNFKKFRRRGAEQGVQTQKVIVTLEEAPPKKGFGVGDAFFLEDVEPSFRFRSSKKTRDDDSSEPEPGFTRRKRTQPPEVVNVEESGPDDEEIQVPGTRNSSGRTQRIEETQVEEGQTQTQRGAKKRGPASSAAGQPASKRGKVSRRDDDSDEEETGFRFKRRR